MWHLQCSKKSRASLAVTAQIAALIASTSQQGVGLSAKLLRLIPPVTRIQAQQRAEPDPSQRTDYDAGNRGRRRFSQDASMKHGSQPPDVEREHEVREDQREDDKPLPQGLNPSSRKPASRGHRAGPLCTQNIRVVGKRGGVLSAESPLHNQSLSYHLSALV